MEDIKLGLNIIIKPAQASLKKLVSDISKATSAGSSNIDNLEAKFKKTTVAVEQQTKKVNELKEKLRGLESGEIAPKATVSLEKKLDSLNIKLAKTKAKLHELDVQEINLVKSGKPVVGSDDLYYTPEQDAKLLKLNNQSEILMQQKKALKQEILEVKEALDKAYGSDTQAEIEKTNLQLQKAQANLDATKAKATIAGEKLNAETQKGLFNFSGLTNSVEKFGNRILGLAKRVFIFTLFTKAFRALRDTIGNVLMADSSFVATLKNLKGSLWTAFSPILEFIVPAIKTLVYWLTVAVNAIAKLIATLTGKSFKAMQASGKSFANQAKSVENASKGQKKLKKSLKDTNKELKKSIAEFDELNILQDKNADTNAGSGTGGGLSPTFGDIEAKITQTMAAIMMAVSGALVALGLILMFTGNIGWGIAAIIAGIAIFSITQEAKITDLDPSIGIDAKLQTIINLAIGLCAAIGIILLFVPKMTLWGVALIAMGIGAFGVSQAFFTDPSGKLGLKEKLLVIAQGIGLAVAVIGLILLFFPATALKGMAMIAAGCRIFKYSSQTLNASGISTKIKEFMEQNVSIIIGVSAVLAIVGIVLIMFKATMLQGFACLTAGVSAFAMSDKATDGALTDKIKTFMKDNVGIIAAISAVLIIVGIVLCFIGATLKIGIACIIAGVAALGITEKATDGALKDTISKFFTDNMLALVEFGAALLILGIIVLIASGGTQLPIGIGLVLGGLALIGSTLAKSKDPNWEWFKSKVADIFNTVKNWIKENGKFAFGVLLLFTGFLTPLGVGLIVDSATGIFSGSEKEPIWDFLLSKIQECWRDISTWWGDGHSKGKPSYWFTKQGWIDIGTAMLNGIKEGLAGFNTWIESKIQKVKEFVGLGGKVSKNGGSNYTGGGSGGGIRTSVLRSAVPNSISVPALAKGAVLPPNKPFLSIVGDQTSGTNIETQLDTMVQAFNTALQQNGGYGNQPIIIEMDDREFGRAVLKQGNREAKRTTGKLVFG